MNTLITKLIDKGCDINSAMGRFLDDEEFYVQCYEQVMIDPNFERLMDALKEGDPEASFEAAHSLKGVIANMEISPMLALIVKIVEPLRPGSGSASPEKCQELLPVCEELLSLKNEFASLTND